MSKLGRWICIERFNDYDDFKCSECGYIAEESEMFSNKCPMCESKMIPYEYPVEEYGNSFDDWEE